MAKSKNIVEPEIEVAAEVLDLATTKPDMPSVSFAPAAIDADFGQMLEWANAIKSVYATATFTEDAEGYRTAKSERAAIRSYVKEIEARRKSIKADYSAPLVAFESKVKQITGALSDAADVCDSFVKGWEDAERARKYDALQTAYEEYAPILVPVLPFSRFYDLMQSAGRKWHNKTPVVAKCIEELQEDVDRVAADWEYVQKLETAHPDVAQRDFFRTLDANVARRSAEAADEEDRRIAELRAEQERIRAEQEQAAREYAERQAEEQRRRMEEAAALAESESEQQWMPCTQTGDAPQGVRSAHEAPVSVPVAPESTEPQNAPSPAPQQPQTPDSSPWVVLIESATVDQMRGLGMMLKEMGLKGTIRRQ